MALLASGKRVVWCWLERKNQRKGRKIFRCGCQSNRTSGGAKSPKLLTSSPDSPRVIVKSGGAGGLDWIQLSSSSSPLPFLCGVDPAPAKGHTYIQQTQAKTQKKKREKESCVFFSFFLLIFISFCCCFLFWASVPSIVDGPNIWLFCPATLSLPLTPFFCFLFYFLLREGSQAFV
jgi:hypothetical protein